LRLWHARVSDAGFKALCDSPHLNALRSLKVRNDSLTLHSARAFADATGLPDLTELDLGGTNRIGPDGTLILVHKPAAGRLRKLNLWSNGVADYGVEAIGRAPHMCHLTHLDVSGNLLTSRAAVAIAAAEHLKTLEELSLRTNGISGEGALALADSPHLANLRRLDLGGNNIGAKAAARLRERFGTRVVLD
jgi:Leucine-rich repeat (LRR) protein